MSQKEAAGEDVEAEVEDVDGVSLVRTVYIGVCQAEKGWCAG